MNRVYEMKLHEEITINKGNSGAEYCRRVAGGWLYSVLVYSDRGVAVTSTFVPFSNEFMEREEE